MEKQITLGTQTITYNPETLVITSDVDYSTARRECVAETHYTNDDDIFKFETDEQLDCIIFTGGNNYVGEYDSALYGYESDGNTIVE